jgi:succinate dehydrogenase / fumarate reductase membrane anchor subunit
MQEPKSSYSALLWLGQVVTGILLLFTLGLHMFAHHYVVEDGLRDFNQVLDYVSNPLIFVVEIIFLIVVSIHAMLGVRSILFDLGPAESMKKVINWGVTVVGAGTIIYGIWLALEIQALS